MKPYFIESSEKTQAILGINSSNYYEQTGRIGSGFCVASDKRVYFKGTSYYSNGGGYKSSIEDRVVDINSIKGTGFTFRTKMSPIPLVICLIAAIITGVIGVMLFIESQGKTVWIGDYKYNHWGADSELESFAIGILVVTGILLLVVFIGFFNKKRLFWIAFEGGKIAYNAMYFNENEIAEFQRQLNVAKENYMNMYPAQPIQYAQPMQYAQPVQYAESIQNIQPVQSVPAQQYNSVADELMKCKSLLETGAISTDEYEQMKKKILEMNNF